MAALLDIDAADFGTEEISDSNSVLVYAKGFSTYSSTAPTATEAPCSVEYFNSTGEGVRPVITVNSCVQ